jgi:hypothetical protein
MSSWHVAAITKLRTVCDKWEGAMQFTGETGVLVFEGRLTKRALLGLPAGIFLVSNVALEDRTPRFAEELGTSPSREEVWIRLRELKLAGTKFYGYRNAAESRQHRSTFRTLQLGPVCVDSGTPRPSLRKFV